METAWIKKLDTLQPDGYNVALGGSGTKHTEETKQKIREKAKNRKSTPEANAKRSLAAKAMWTNATQELKQKMMANISTNEAKAKAKAGQRAIEPYSRRRIQR